VIANDDALREGFVDRHGEPAVRESSAGLTRAVTCLRASAIR
jgi:hypothetical protein